MADFAMATTGKLRHYRRMLQLWTRALISVLVSPGTAVAVLTLIGTGSGIAAAAVIFGLGGALAAGCVFALTLAALVAKGVDHG